MMEQPNQRPSDVRVFLSFIFTIPTRCYHFHFVRLDCECQESETNYRSCRDRTNLSGDSRSKSGCGAKVQTGEGENLSIFCPFSSYSHRTESEYEIGRYNVERIAEEMNFEI